MKPKPTAKEKFQQNLFNRASSQLIFHKIKTWKEALEVSEISASHPSLPRELDLSAAVTSKEFYDWTKIFFASEKEREKAKADSTVSGSADSKSVLDDSVKQDNERPRNLSILTTAQDKGELALDVKISAELLELFRSNGLDKVYSETSPWYSPKQIATLFPFQLRGSRRLLHSCMIKQHKADILSAKTGVGKTFMYLQFVRWLVDLNWHEGRTLGPLPYAIITKTPIVEQTKRVAKNYFGLCPHTQILVTSYDQLRSSFGKQVLHNYIVIEDGIEHKKFMWHYPLRPVCMIWDESQSLKNERSQQSMIAQAYNDHPEVHAQDSDIDYTASGGIGWPDKTYQLFASATALLRVADAKCYVVAMQKNWV